MNGLNTLNLVQVSGGVNIKQGDSKSVLEYELGYNDGSSFMSDLGLNGKSAQINLYSRIKETRWSTSSTVVDNRVKFTIDEALGLGVYTVDITVDGHVFPSDRSALIRVHEGYQSYMDGKSAAVAVATARNIANEGIRLAVLDGLSDLKGPQGERGATGPKGDKGDRGETGPMGPRGYKGDRGETGPRGEKGLTGDTGPRGSKGVDGTVSFDSLTDAQRAMLRVPIVNDLTTGGVDKALSAEQGKVLSEKIKSAPDFDAFVRAKPVYAKDPGPTKKLIDTNDSCYKICVDNEKNLFVATRNHGVIKYSKTEGGAFTQTFSFVPPDNPTCGGLGLPSGGTIYVASNNGYIYKLDKNGQRIWEWKNRKNAYYLDIDQAGCVYFVDNSNELVKLNPDGSKGQSAPISEDVNKIKVYGGVIITAGDRNVTIFEKQSFGTIKKIDVPDRSFLAFKFGPDSVYYQAQGYCLMRAPIKSREEKKEILPLNGGALYEYVVIDDASYCVTCDLGEIYCFDFSDNLRWKFSASRDLDFTLAYKSAALYYENAGVYKMDLIDNKNEVLGFKLM